MHDHDVGSHGEVGRGKCESSRTAVFNSGVLEDRRGLGLGYIGWNARQPTLELQFQSCSETFSPDFTLFTCRDHLRSERTAQVSTMTTTGIETEVPCEPSHVESQGPFHRVFVERGSFLCLPSALFTNDASEARDHCGITRSPFVPDISQ